MNQASKCWLVRDANDKVWFSLMRYTKTWGLMEEARLLLDSIEDLFGKEAADRADRLGKNERVRVICTLKFQEEE